MNEHVSSLYVRAHELLNLGMDGSPIYSDHFARLNREVYEQALDLYNTLEGNTPEEEAELCLSILVALNATFYDNGRKQQVDQGRIELLDESPPLGCRRFAPQLVGALFGESLGGFRRTETVLRISPQGFGHVLR